MDGAPYRILGMEPLAPRRGYGLQATHTSSMINSFLRTLDTTSRANSIYNMSICSNTTAIDATKSTTVMCLVKGRGKAMTETGIASMDLRRNTLRMSQFCDDQLYNQLMTKVHMMDPVEIVVAATLRESSVLDGLFDKLNRNFPAVKIQCIPRRYMSEAKGKEYISKLCSQDSTGVDVAISSKVYALLAVSGLLNYVQESLSMYLAPNTMKMVYHSGVNSMLIDHGTAVNLELLRAATCGSDTLVTAQSVFSVINHTNTLTGALTLRSNLLEPPTDAELIEARYEAVEELLENVEMFTTLQSALVKFPDIERAITLSIQIPKAESRATAESKIRNILCLKTALDLVPCLSEIIRTAKSTLLINLRKKLLNDGLERILALILDKLNSNATVTSGLLSMRGQIVFAVKSGLDGKLDAMRNVYNSLIDETDEAVRHLAETYQLVLKLAYTSQRGFHVTYKIPKSTDLPDLPQEFMKITKSRGVVSMTTDKLIILNARIAECLECIYSLSNRIVSDLLKDIHKEIPCLNSLVTATGNLDMLTSFATISRQPEFVRPQIGELLALKAARHPVAEVTQKSNRIVPNDVYISPEANFIVITGANNSGKSFYLRTVAVLQVMAQIGCFVAADFAMIRICDQLFSRIGSDNVTDNLESSFTVEMKEIAFVLRHRTPTALIILDELCRGTSSHEGIDICFTICNQLLNTSAFTLFATHFKELCILENTNDNCNNYCFVTKYKDSDGNTVQCIVNDHKLKKGIAQGSRYGLKLAATMNFPKEIISDAFRVAKELEGHGSKLTNDSAQTNQSSKSIQSRLERKIYAEMKLISKHSSSKREKVQALQHLQTKYADDWRTAPLMPDDKKKGNRLDQTTLSHTPSIIAECFTEPQYNLNADPNESGTTEAEAPKTDNHRIFEPDISSFSKSSHAASDHATSSVAAPVYPQNDDHFNDSFGVKEATSTDTKLSWMGLPNYHTSIPSSPLSIITSRVPSLGRSRREALLLLNTTMVSGDSSEECHRADDNTLKSLSVENTGMERAQNLPNKQSYICNHSSPDCNESHTTKLVDYSLSPIAQSGSVVYYPHSVTMSPLYRTSKNKYREPSSRGSLSVGSQRSFNEVNLNNLDAQRDNFLPTNLTDECIDGWRSDDRPKQQVNLLNRIFQNVQANNTEVNPYPLFPSITNSGDEEVSHHADEVISRLFDCAVSGDESSDSGLSAEKATLSLRYSAGELKSQDTSSSDSSARYSSDLTSPPAKVRVVLSNQSMSIKVAADNHLVSMGEVRTVSPAKSTNALVHPMSSVARDNCKSGTGILSPTLTTASNQDPKVDKQNNLSPILASSFQYQKQSHDLSESFIQDNPMHASISRSAELLTSHSSHLTTGEDNLSKKKSVTFSDDLKTNSVVERDRTAEHLRNNFTTPVRDGTVHDMSISDEGIRKHSSSNLQRDKISAAEHFSSRSHSNEQESNTGVMSTYKMGLLDEIMGQENRVDQPARIAPQGFSSIKVEKKSPLL